MGQPCHQYLPRREIWKRLIVPEGPTEESPSQPETALRFRHPLPQTRCHRGKSSVIM